MQPETNSPRPKRIISVAIMLVALLAVALGAAFMGSGAFNTASVPSAASGKLSIQPQAPGASAASAAKPVNVQSDPNVPSQTLGNAKVIVASYADTSPALRDIPPAADIARPAENENPLPYKPANQGVVDPIVQTFFGPLAMPTPIVNFAGIPNLCSCSPPDVNADVSANYVVETVNAKIQVWNKTGTSLLGPVNINTLFAGTGTACATHNDGDPVVLHDQMADRWLVTQFTSSAPYGQCLAVSTTADPTGSYHRYFFAQGSLLNDYPHYGIWPDAYLFTANRFAGNAFDSPIIGAFDRVKMLAGDPTATYQEINPGNFFYAILPADVDGSTMPPAGSPGLFASVSGTVATMRTWRYHVDFATPGNTTLTGPINVAIAPFDGDMCGGARNCIPQLGTTNKLDAIAGRIMHRLSYRNMGSYDTLLASGTVDVNGADLAGIRWYEVHNPLGIPSVYQQGTYSPDNTQRWMPSIAMDRDGNIAVEYSASSATINPQIRYAGRLAGDPLGQLSQGEATLFAGTGSQTGSQRWGDYTSLTVDPSDDCTFWAANEYLAANGGNWQTRIGSFKFPGCGNTTPTPTVTGTPPTATNTPTTVPTATAVPTACRNYGFAQATDTITAGITNDTGLHCDDCGSLTDLPFPIQFYNQTFNSIAFSSNGAIQFGSTDYSFGNDCLPVPVVDYAIFPWWDDLVTNVAGTGIYTGVTGVAPNRTFHVELKAQSLSDNGLIDAEVRLHENTSNFEIVYGTITSDSVNATIGTQALYSSGTYTQVSCNTTGITTGTRLNFTIATCPVQPTNTPTTVPPSATSTSTSTTAPGSPTVTNTPGGPTVTPTACTLEFADVLPGNTFYANIHCLACQGIINGYPCGGDGEPCNSNNDPYFRPSNNITRGQLAKVVSLSAGFNEPVTGQTFEDVAPGTTFYEFVERLASRGVMGGYPCGFDPAEPCVEPGNLPYFRPSDNATRGQLTKIVSNAAGFSDPDPSTFTFTDVPAGSTFHLYVERLLINRPGVMNGYPCGGAGEPCDDQNRPYFRPSATLTRGQTSKIVANTFFPDCAVR